MSKVGQHDELSPGAHWSWHLALGGAGALVAMALLLDPAAGASSLENAQRQIAQVGLGALAVALVGLWLLRRRLSADASIAAGRWRDAPALAPASMVPSLRPRGFAGAMWLLLAVWSVAVVVGLWTTAQWVVDATWENGLLETATVLGYGLAAVLAVLCARRGVRADAPGGARRWWFVLLAAGCLLIAGEETDWGQTYLQYDTPDAFREANIQSDFSLHNLAPPSVVPGTRWANWLLRTLGWVGGGLLPVLLFASATVRRAIFALEFPVPPAWCMAVLFLAAWIPEFEGLYIRNNIGSELREFSISVAIFVWLASQWRASASASGAR